MEVYNEKRKDSTKNPSLHRFIITYIPYWHIFLILYFITGLLSFSFLQTSIPLYESFASVMIKDERRGQVDSKMEEVLNVFGQKNIVENEVEVLKSNSLLREVVINLKLNLPIWEEMGWNGHKKRSAYHSCPYVIEVKDSIVQKNSDKIYFDIKNNKSILVNGNLINIGEWFEIQNEKIRFIPNPNFWEGYAKNGSRFYIQLRSNEKVADILSSRLSVLPASKQASVVFLKVRDEVPERGESILLEIIKTYALVSVRKKNETAQLTLGFIENRLNKVTTELDSVERGIEFYRNESGVVDINEQSSQYLRSIEQNDLELNKMKMQLAVIDEIEKYIRNSDHNIIAPSISNISDPNLSQLLDRLYLKEQERDKLKRTTAENNPILTSVDAEISRIKSGVTENITNHRKNIEAGQAYLTGVSSKYNAMLNSIPRKEKELQDVSRQRNIKSNIYSFLLQKKEEALYALKSSVADVQLVEIPSSGNSPVVPKLPFIAALTLLFPIIIGMGLISFREYINGKVLYRTDIDSLISYPIIAEIGFDPSQKAILSTLGSRSFVQEQFRHLRTAFNHIKLTQYSKPKIMITSSIEGDGKTFIAGNFAISLARTGKKVLLLGLDLYKPKIHELFHVDLGIGISDWLLGHSSFDEIIRSTSIEGLSIITAGTSIENPNELLTEKPLHRYLDALTDRFDVIIMDTPPIYPVSDALEIAKYCDLVFFVVRHDHTPKSILKHIDMVFTQHNITAVQIIFNGIKARGFGKYRYGEGYGYGIDNRISYKDYGNKKRRIVA